MDVLSCKPFELVAPDGAARSEGVHVGGIIKYILSTIDPETYDRTITHETRQYWELGFTWELAVSRALVERYLVKTPHLVVQLELEHDGVFGTPDAFDTKKWVLYEMKLTKMSSNRDISDVKVRHWLWQIKAYLKMLEAQEAYIVACYIMGNYRDVPLEVRMWHLRFSQHEIDVNWRMLMVNKDRMLEERNG